MEQRLQVFERHHEQIVTWTSVGTTFRNPIHASAASHAKVEKLFVEAARERIRKMPPPDRAALPRPLGVFLNDVRVDLSLRGELGRRQLTRTFPFVLETRRVRADRVVHVYHHPLRHEERFVFPQQRGHEVGDWLRAVLSKAWADLDDGELETLAKQGKERLRLVVFDEPACTLAQAWAQKDRGERPKASGDRPPLLELPRLATDLTRHVASGASSAGLARIELDRRVAALALGPSVDAGGSRAAFSGRASARSFVIVGPPGSGRSTLLRRAVRSLLAHDGHEVHGNLDRVSHVWELSARRVLAGMSRLGEWEKRLLRICDEARAHRGVLCFTDVALLGVVGRSRESDRAFADVLEGPVSRGEIALWGEATPEGMQRLADEAPRLAELLPRLHLESATPSETHAMLLHRAREVERNAGAFTTARGSRMHLEIDPLAIPAIVTQTRALFPGVANPAKSMTILDRLATRALALREAQASPRHAPSEALPEAGDLVLEVLEERTGVPVPLLDGSALVESQLEARFAGDVVGQPDATRAVVDLVLRLKTRLTDPRRPRAVYLFTGPTGTGKTETAKWIARHVFGHAARLCRFDMAELSGPDGAARLLGTGTPGEASLVARIREQPFSVVLFDEIEKAHRSVLYLLLQLFDEGRLTDPNGATADFTSAVLVMTSNLGARPRPRAGFATGSESESAMHEVARAVRDHFPPELFHRIDRIVPFRPLDAAMARAIVRRELGLLLGRRGLTERRIAVEATDRVIELALEQAFDPQGGARSVKRWLEAHVAGLLADEIARSERAEQRRLTLHVRAPGPDAGNDGGLAVHTEALREATPLERSFVSVAPDLDAAALVALTERVARPLFDEREDVIERLRAAQGALLRADPRTGYAIESAIAEIHAIRDTQRELSADETEQSRELYEDELERTRTVQRGRTWSRREARPHLHLGRAAPDRGRERTPRAVREHLARALTLVRALEHVDDPREHVVDVLVSRLGVRGAGRVGPFAAAIAPSPGALVGAAVRVGDLVHEVEPAALADVVTAEEAVLRFVGLGVRSELGPEHGTHLLVTDDGAPELIAVQVLVDAPDRPAALFARRDLARTGFREALEAGGPVPPSPDPLLPLVRAVRLSRAGHERFEATLEDHALGEVLTGRVRDLADAVELARDRWRLRLPETPDRGGEAR